MTEVPIAPQFLRKVAGFCVDTSLVLGYNEVVAERWSGREMQITHWR